MNNFGFLNKERNKHDYVLGSNNPVKWNSIIEYGQWGDYLVEKELQDKGTATQACVSFAATNVIEILMKQQVGIERNLSDRFTAKMSGTGENGNYFFNVANSLKNDGFLDEQMYPYVDGWGEYYKEIPENLINIAKDNKDLFWRINYRWVDADIESIKEGLKYSPLLISARYAQGADGEVLNPKGIQNHAMTCYGYAKGKYWLIMDSYEYGGHLKRYDWNYKFGAVMGFKLTNKLKEYKMPIKDNYLYQLVEAPGGFAMGLDDSLIIDDSSKLLASFIMRNKGDIKGKTMSVGKMDWESVPHKNLKMEII